MAKKVFNSTYGTSMRRLVGAQKVKDLKLEVDDSDYEKIIISHTKEIIAEAKNYKEQSGIEMKYLADCVAQEFMEHGNIIRAGDRTGFSSSDPIYRAVRNLVLTAQELGAFDKPRQKKKTAEQEK